MIIIDENVDKHITKQLHNTDYQIFLIREYNAGISDKDVIEIAKSKKGIVITEDKDFGELVFSHDIKGCSVIFLRYDKSDYKKIIQNIIIVLKNYYYNPEHFFITITTQKIRIRKI